LTITDYVINWDNGGDELKKSTANLRSSHLYFKESVTWNALSSGLFCARFSDKKTIFDSAGSSLFINNGLNTLNTYTGILNSKVSQVVLNIINPTLNYGSGSVGSLPIVKINSEVIDSDIYESISISKTDWNAHENSIDFQQNELIKQQKGTLSEALEAYQSYWSEKFYELHRNEEELNRQFIEIYGLQEELTPEVPLEEITILQEEAKIVNGALSIELVPVLLQLLSYAVGCLFGRYSLDKEGLILANQGETLQDYFLHVFGNATPPLGQSDGSAGGLFLPDEDNIIPVLEGEWFNDDIVGRFRAFLKAAFGEEHFDQNLRFIEDTLGKDIRKYFVKDFYNDHIKRYKKRPIYWMFSSPKGHFKALMYLHRYQPDLCSKLLNDYLQAFISKLEAAKHTQTMLSVREDISAREKIAANKEIDKLELMLKDCRDYERTLFLIATQKISMDLDDGVKVNYQKFKDVLVPIKGLEKEED